MVWGPSEDPAGRKSCKISSNLAWIFLVFLHVYELCKILNQMLKESYGITVHLLQLFCFISFIFFSSKRERETKKEVGAGRAQSFLFEFVFSLNFFIFFCFFVFFLSLPKIFCWFFSFGALPAGRKSAQTNYRAAIILCVSVCVLFSFAIGMLREGWGGLFGGFMTFDFNLFSLSLFFVVVTYRCIWTWLQNFNLVETGICQSLFTPTLHLWFYSDFLLRRGDGKFIHWFF